MKITKMNNPKKITEASGRDTVGGTGSISSAPGIDKVITKSVR